MSSTKELNSTEEGGFEKVGDNVRERKKIVFRSSGDVATEDQNRGTTKSDEFCTREKL